MNIDTTARAAVGGGVVALGGCQGAWITEVFGIGAGVNPTGSQTGTT